MRALESARPLWTVFAGNPFPSHADSLISVGFVSVEEFPQPPGVLEKYQIHRSEGGGNDSEQYYSLHEFAQNIPKYHPPQRPSKHE